MSKCPYCTTGNIIHTNSHCWDIDPIEDMGCYSEFKDNKLFGFSKWKFCPICGRKLEKEKTPSPKPPAKKLDEKTRKEIIAIIKEIKTAIEKGEIKWH